MAEWGLLLLLLVVSAIIWQRSAVQVLKPLTEENVYLRFDLGISAFLVLLIVKTMLLTKGGIVIERPVLEILFIPFFAMGFLTVGLMLNREAVFKSYLTGFHKIGIAISFAFVVLTTGVCVVFIFQSQLVSSAEIITDGLKKAGRPLLGIFIAIIRFLFRPRHFEMESKRSSQGSTALGSVEGGEESGFFEEVLQWGIVGFTSLVLLVSLFIIFRILLGYLLSRSNSAKDLAFKFPDLADWIRQLKVFIRKLLNTVFRLFKKMKTGSDFYKMLIRWGRHSGVSCHQAETPLEYSQRLSHSFPELTREIDIIADLIHQDLYADKELSYQQIYLGRKVGRRMRNPVFWAKRLKSWIVTSDS